MIDHRGDSPDRQRIDITRRLLELRPGVLARSTTKSKPIHTRLRKGGKAGKILRGQR